MESELLIIFSRYPRAGKVKTRLVPELGEVGAARLHRQMTGLTVLTARQAQAGRRFRLWLDGTGAPAALFRRWLGGRIRFREQGRGTLGQRMDRAFRVGFRRGAERVVIVGTDVPAITPAIIGQAFDALKSQDLVLGPARDGGYYLLGLRRPVPALFEGIGWGTGTVLRDTLVRAQEQALAFTRLVELDDVDRPEDLVVWDAIAGTQHTGAQQDRISVVIPALNEAEALAGTIARARAFADEMFVVDGGSQDRTRDIAYEHGAMVLSAPRGRAYQMNAGALAASGDILLFLHADTHLPATYGHYVRETLALPHTVAGAFGFRMVQQARRYRLIEKATNIRSRGWDLPYGDQGLFMRRSMFIEMGGYACLAAMEDYDLVRRLRHVGRIRTARVAARTSGRRWQTLGATRATLVNQLMILGYHSGVNSDRLRGFYWHAARARKRRLEKKQHRAANL
jgi:rSAM/selenodomain-associated transferase 2/rSAM/selenodomain-associated transferase 1